MKRIFIYLTTLFFLSTCCISCEKDNVEETITDSRDGNIYKTVKIGNQRWMAENLAYLPSVSPSSAGSLTDPYYYVLTYQGTSISEAKASANYINYGVLYNWPAAMNGAISSTTNPSGVQGVCPTGWHLPSDAEWTQLTNYLGGESVAGSKLKETGTTHWKSPNTGATNETGFTALPCTFRYIDGKFGSIGGAPGWWGYWWSSTDTITHSALERSMSYSFSKVNSNYRAKSFGISVRCVRDN